MVSHTCTYMQEETEEDENSEKQKSYDDDDHWGAVAWRNKPGSNIRGIKEVEH